MIQNTLATVMVLLGIEAVVLWSSRQARFQGFFKYIPPVFWIYFLPMLASTVGLLDPEHPVYQKLINNLLPASLVILLMVVDIKAILKLGRTALFMFFAGSFGMMLGTVVSFFIFKGWVGAEFWAGFGALSGSWTGGSANMVAVKEAIGTPDAVFAPMVVVDTVVPYCWMGILVAFAGMQPLYDRWNNSDRRVLDYLSRRVEPAVGSPSQKLMLKKTVLIFAISAVAALAAKSAA
ncbi:MAG: DUF819 family protein, partial [Candidatus Omnitrophota bacterium]|nr:DUF819 family protein [Candidatus Omnitrophota bacterium]